jgi:hypothetical protein
MPMISYDDKGIAHFTYGEEDSYTPLEPHCRECGKKVCQTESECTKIVRRDFDNPDLSNMYNWLEICEFIHFDICVSEGHMCVLGNDEWLFRKLLSTLDTDKDIIYLLIYLFKDIKVSKTEIFTYILELAEDMLNEGNYLEIADLLKTCSA